MEYYKLAFIHRSAYQKTADGHRQHNERLEFLGDSVLGTVVSDILYEKFPDKSEGELTSIRSKLVQRTTLNKLGLDLGLDKFIISSLNCVPQKKNKMHIHGNAFEALMGAIYLDQGYERCLSFMKDPIYTQYINLHDICLEERNFKSRFIEWAQQYKLQYQFVLADSLLDRKQNSTNFTTHLEVEGIKVGQGSGASKKESQQSAAKVAMLAVQDGTITPELIISSSITEDQ